MRASMAQLEITQGMLDAPLKASSRWCQDVMCRAEGLHQS